MICLSSFAEEFFRIPFSGGRFGQSSASLCSEMRHFKKALIG